ncbi:MAG: restriction endonuclease subunit S [Prosthecobacter sp.]|nr:restriction endonuclease subunit S [Prosthecobacter sp.]
MAIEWRAELLRDLIVTTKDGDWGKGDPECGHSAYNVIRGTDFAKVRFGDVSCVPLRYLPEKTVARRTLEPNDILIETAGGTKDRPTGRTLLVTQHILERFSGPVTCASFARFLRINTAKADPAFVFWYLQYLYEKGEMSQHQVQHTGVARFQYTRFAETQNIPLPPLPEQKAIARILGALDDKIELNRRMNATLEAMARALFQSWFVDFDPVRAKQEGRAPAGLDEATAALFPDQFQDSELGPIPQGWTAAKLGQVINIFDSKRVPLSVREREKRRGVYPYHGAASVMDYIDDYLFDGIYVLMGEDGSVVNKDGTPVLQYVWGKFWVNNHAHVLTGKEGICTEHIILHLKGCNITPFVNGAVQPKLNQGNMNRIDFVLPSSPVSKAFGEAIAPLFARIRANVDESRTLATLRDTLLPKLLSGEISAINKERIAG